MSFHVKRSATLAISRFAFYQIRIEFKSKDTLPIRLYFIAAGYDFVEKFQN